MEITKETFKEDSEYKWPLFKAAAGLQTFLFTILLVFLFYQTLKFLRIYKFSNKWLVLFFLMLNLYGGMRIAYFVEEILLYPGSWLVAEDKWIQGVLSGVDIEVFC